MDEMKPEETEEFITRLQEQANTAIEKALVEIGIIVGAAEALEEFERQEGLTFHTIQESDSWKK